MLGLLREICNFILFKIHGCIVQQSLNFDRKYKFLFYIVNPKLSGRTYHQLT